MPPDRVEAKYRPAMQELLFGLFLLALSALVQVSTRQLSPGSAADMGPGYVPRAIAWTMAAFAALFIVKSLRTPGEKIVPPYWRGVILVPAAVAVFALLIERAGLAPASFLAMLTVSLASEETRLLEVAVFSAAVSAACVLLFVKALALPVPIFAG